ncbi:MAG: UPF0149 family protein [Halioglobus sp.]
MFDERPGEPGVFDFDEIANHLLDQGQQTSPADLHGCLTGLLASGVATSAEAALDNVCTALHVTLHGELAEIVQNLYTVTAAALIDESFDFHPLLPDDDTELEVRTQALADWSRAFLAGYAQGKVTSGATGAAVAADSAEALRDLAVIAQAGIDEDATEEESEQSYAEILEYLRVAALNVFLDSEGAGDSSAADNPELPLH